MVGTNGGRKILYKVSVARIEVILNWNYAMGDSELETT